MFFIGIGAADSADFSGGLDGEDRGHVF